MRLRFPVTLGIGGFGGLYALSRMDSEDAWAILPIYFAAAGACWLLVIAAAAGIVRGINNGDGW